MWGPGLPYVGRNVPDRIDHIRVYGRVLVRLGIITQIFLIVVASFGWVFAGASRRPLGIGLCAAAIVAVLIDRGVIKEAKSSTSGANGGCFGWLHLWGWACLTVMAIALLSLVGRVSSAPISWAFISFLLCILAGWVADTAAISLGRACYELWLADKRRMTWRVAGIGLAVTPIVAGWFCASIYIRMSGGEPDTVRARIGQHRAESKTCDAWTVRGKPINVAVALSGGGYRAALSHAGVLAALDDQCVPIRILSTVSGGSIIGAAYVLGVPPREFARRLARRPPALPDDLLSIFNLLDGATQKYVRHFQRVFFGDHTIGDLPKWPKFLINVTNVDASPELAREVITNNWAPREADTLRIADAVAASASFPGFFGPIKLLWTNPEIDGGRLSAHFFVDGGVVENWGLEGLRQFVSRLPADQWDLDHPSILIVSDASAYGERPKRTPFELDMTEAWAVANDIQFAASQRFTFAEVTGMDSLANRISMFPAWQQYTTIDYPRRYLSPGIALRFHEESTSRPVLSTVIVPITSTETTDLLRRYPNCKGPAGASAVEIQQRVRMLPTLNELSTSEANDVFWLGYSLGTIYGQAIECARRSVVGSVCSAEPEFPKVRCSGL
jgi:predicted acylesterase/phospholipase RssA